MQLTEENSRKRLKIQVREGTVEPVKAKVRYRSVPEDRIKTLHVRVLKTDGISDDYFVKEAGHAIASKLAEYHKVHDDGLHLHFVIDVIVPATPESPWPKSNT